DELVDIEREDGGMQELPGGGLVPAVVGEFAKDQPELHAVAVRQIDVVAVFDEEVGDGRHLVAFHLAEEGAGAVDAKRGLVRGHRKDPIWGEWSIRPCGSGRLYTDWAGGKARVGVRPLPGGGVPLLPARGFL